MQINIAQFNGYVERKLITCRQHTSEPLLIWNYTPLCQYEGAWDEVTMMCRGLITDLEGNVIAKPFTKFFNLNERPDQKLGDIIEIAEKLDGSLGILYPTKDGYAIATRGSFNSTQAKHATKVLQEYLANGATPMAGVNYLFEIIYPANRVVVDYGQEDDLVLLARLDMGGNEVTAKDAFAQQFKKPRKYLGKTLTEVINAPAIDNAEGYVLLFDDGLRLKFKFEEYKRLHRIVTNTSSYDIWDALRNGSGIEGIIEHVPDEFYDWVHSKVEQITVKHDEAIATAAAVYDLVNWLDRKAIADSIKGKPPTTRAIVWALLDGKTDVVQKVAWAYAKPAYERPFAQTEDAN